MVRLKELEILKIKENDAHSYTQSSQWPDFQGHTRLVYLKGPNLQWKNFRKTVMKIKLSEVTQWSITSTTTILMTLLSFRESIWSGKVPNQSRV